MITRRAFGHLALVLTPIAYAASFLYGAVRFLSPLPQGRRKERLEVGPVADFKAGKVERVTFNGRSIYVLDVDGTILALDSLCTHLACNVNWQPEAGFFECPCHGGGFDRHGNVLKEPPSRPLRRQKLTIEDDAVILLDEGEPT